MAFERRVVYPDTANRSTWFIGPDYHSSSHPIARQFDRYMKTERHIEFASTGSTLPDITGRDTQVSYLHDPQAKAGQYYYLSPMLVTPRGIVLEQVEQDATRVMYKTFAGFHPVLVTEVGIYWLDGTSGGVHFGVELPAEEQLSSTPNVLFSKGEKSQDTFTKQVGVIGEHPVSMSIRFNRDLLGSVPLLKRFLEAPYSLSESRNGISPRFIVH